MTTLLHSKSGSANLFGLLPKSLAAKGFKYGLNIAAKETHRTRPMAISMLIPHTDPSHLAVHMEKSNFTLHVVIASIRSPDTITQDYLRSTRPSLKHEQNNLLPSTRTITSLPSSRSHKLNAISYIDTYL